MRDNSELVCCGSVPIATVADELRLNLKGGVRCVCSVVIINVRSRKSLPIGNLVSDLECYFATGVVDVNRSAHPLVC